MCWRRCYRTEHARPQILTLKCRFLCVSENGNNSVDGAPGTFVHVWWLFFCQFVSVPARALCIYQVAGAEVVFVELFGGWRARYICQRAMALLFSIRLLAGASFCPIIRWPARKWIFDGYCVIRGSYMLLAAIRFRGRSFRVTWFCADVDLKFGKWERASYGTHNKLSLEFQRKSIVTWPLVVMLCADVDLMAESEKLRHTGYTWYRYHTKFWSCGMSLADVEETEKGRIKFSLLT